MNKLSFGDIEVSKKQFYESKKAVNLSSVDVNKIVVSNKIFIGYIDDISGVVTSLCIILPQMSGWIKYFENGGKNRSFKVEDDEAYIKYNSIWNEIKELLSGIKLFSDPIYDNSYIKTKVRTFSELIKTLFDGNEIPEKRIEHACIACISIDSILKVDKKNYTQIYLEQCKYKKKRGMKSFIHYEIELDSNHESD